MNLRTLEQTILWRRTDPPGHDACGIWSTAQGWRLAGTALFFLDGQPCRLDYRVSCDTNWRTRSASVSGWLGRRELKFSIVASARARWRLNGADQAAVSDCIDLDLAFTPATNLIAIRRLALQVGEEACAPAAWLDFPDPVLQRLEQRYRRISPAQYHYEAPALGYADTLDVSDEGFVTRYPGLWEIAHQP